MESILLHVLYRGEKANDFASEMERNGLRAAVLAEEGCMQYDYYRPLAEENCVLLVEHWRDRAALDKHSAGEPMAKLKALKASYDLATTVERFECGRAHPGQKIRNLLRSFDSYEKDGS